ncbi:YndM family protein [Salsuginibacillus kocurii]|uniref:YndM family protein n=1 Tax=Salsuginibacillus kocurii TaxID=427078 RepID=UPI000370EEEF|nr:YndM family protein [Salsuginibacillus kocurii]
MNHFLSLLIKLVAIFGVFLLVLGLGYGVSMQNIVLFTLILGIGAYLIGDMLILPRAGNGIATAADFGIAFIGLSLLSYMFTNVQNIFTMTLIATVIITIFEYFYHMYLEAQEVEDHSEEDRVRKHNTELQTETSDELSPYPKNENKK